MHLYRLGELNLVLLNRYSLIRVPINESLLYIYFLFSYLYEKCSLTLNVSYYSRLVTNKSRFSTIVV